jgi:alkylation response protein AidB-like acyl-CoA dehydrogenase
MADKFVGERNLRFLLYEVFDVESLCRYSYYQEHSRETFDLVLDTALKMARDMLLPCLSEMDKKPPELVNGEVRVHPVVSKVLTACGEGGWIGASAPMDLGGQQLPLLVVSACHFIMGAANYSASVYPVLSSGAAHLIESFGSSELAETYIPHMFSGKWQGTMALTEPQAGSSLTDITTQAAPTEEGHYLIRGQKIFISAGDHDGAENIVHLMLARIKGAPAGVKGISLFVVPKKRIRENGQLEPNDVTTAGIFHKLGYKGTPIAQLSLGENGDCRGYLVGLPHHGLKYMFQMMNEARIGVGLGATAIASAAYYAALKYAQERPQGRKLSAKDPSAPAIPIIEHADVKRMLLFQKSVVEGSLSLILQCSKYADLAHVAKGEEKERYTLLLDLLTPVAKTYPSEMGIFSVSQGLQCLGGYGYCDEFPLEQFYRDVRIHPIHEGTTGIQGLDLLGRKIFMKNGDAAKLYIQEILSTIQAAEEYPELQPYAERLRQALDELQTVTMSLAPYAMKGQIELFLADSTLYLELFGIIAIAWQWLIQGTAAMKTLRTSLPEHDSLFYGGKLHTLKYFFHYELPKVHGLAKRLTEVDGLTVNMDSSVFSD